MKNMPGMRIFCLIAVLLISLSVRADITRDSLRIDPSAPFDHEDIRVRSYITIPNSCLPVDSATIKKNLAEYYWLQTKCSDPWHTGEMHSDEETYDSLMAYLAGQGITPGYASISYDSTLAEDCESCMCRTGNIIFNYVSVEDSAVLGQLGFLGYVQPGLYYIRFFMDNILFGTEKIIIR
jgi:hypothetical protein